MRFFSFGREGRHVTRFFVNNVKIIRNSSPNFTNQDFHWTRHFRSRQNGKIPYRRADTERKVAAEKHRYH